MVGHWGRQLQSCLPKAAAVTLLTLIAALLDGCARSGTTPLSQPKEVMQVAWGPFARQYKPRKLHGFAAMPAAGDAMVITASTAANERSSVPILYRILRGPSGVSHPAAPGDSGLLAQGSDNPESSNAFARQIGLDRKQIVDPKEALSMPILLLVPTPVEGTLQCRPEGGAVVSWPRNIGIFLHPGRTGPH
jgi:hypothetical protein